MKKLLLTLGIILVALAALGLYGCSEPKLYSFDGQVLRVPTPEGEYRLQAFNEHIIKLHLSLPEEEETPSHAVVMEPGDQVAAVTQEDSIIWMKTASVSAKITLNPFRVGFYRGEMALSQYRGASLSDTLRTVSFGLDEEEKLYGAGERAVPLSRRGYRFELYNAPQYGYGLGAERLNYSLPLVTSSKDYTIFFDNPQRGFVDMGQLDPDQLSFSAIGGDMTCFFIAGEGPAQLTEEYTALTGRQGIPPRWAFGYFLSRFGYKSQEETEEIYESMNEANFPVDAVVLDLFWFGEELKGTMGNLNWHTPKWPNPEQMISGFKEEGTRTILITEPFIVNTSSNFEEAVDEKVLATNNQGEVFLDTTFYFGDAGLIDIFKPEAQDWFWKKYEKQIDIGVGGWWGDLGEPESHPKGMKHVLGDAGEVHNIYGHYWDKMLWEKYRENDLGRLFNLNRSGWAGSQRFDIFPWTGDVSRSWSGYRAQLPLMLTMGMGGLGYTHSDLGGFTPGQKDSELYIRWMQLGVFNPIFRPHSSELPSEPIFYDQATAEVVEELVDLRYAFFPYNYTLAYENHQKGWPLARPLFFHYPNDQRLEEEGASYLWGENLLVAPVLEPGQEEKSQYLPEGQWVYFWNDKLHEGGQEATVSVELEEIPLWVKAGSILPMARFEGNLSNYDPAQLTLHYYPSDLAAQTAYRLYEDDGETVNPMENGAYRVVEATAQASIQEWVLQLAQGEGQGYEGEPESRSITWIIHRASAPSKVLSGGEELESISEAEGLEETDQGYFWEASTQRLYLKTRWSGQASELKVVR